METGKWPESFNDVAITPAGEIQTYKNPGDQVIMKHFSFILIDGRIDVGAIQREQYPSFLYVSDTAVKMTAPVPGVHFYCYYVADGTVKDAKMEGMCKSMGGGDKHMVGSTSTWFPLG